jgi:hypothetical protein
MKIKSWFIVLLLMQYTTCISHLQLIMLLWQYYYSSAIVKYIYIDIKIDGYYHMSLIKWRWDEGVEYISSCQRLTRFSL